MKSSIDDKNVNNDIKEDTSEQQRDDTKKKGLCSGSKNCWKKIICISLLVLSTVVLLAVIAIAIYLCIMFIPKGNSNSNSSDNDRDIAPILLVCYPRYAFTPVCLGDTLYCNCTVISGNGYTQWKFSSPSGTEFCPGNTISLQQINNCTNDHDGCGSYFYAENLPPVGNSSSCQVSRLTIKLNSSRLDGVNVTCRDTITKKQPEAYRIEISGAPLPPKIISLTSAMYDQLSVTWVNVNYTDYYVSINKTSTAGEYLRYDMHPYTYTFTGLENNTIYNVSIIAKNCNGNSSAASVIGRTATCPSLRLTEPSIQKALCPSDTVQYTCILNAVVYDANVTILWNGSAFNCFQENGSIILIQNPNGPLNTSVVMCGDASAVMSSINETCYASVLTIKNPVNFNGSIIQCYDGESEDNIGSEKVVQQFKTNPNTPIITVNTSSSAIMVSWISDPIADSYNIRISGNNITNSANISGSNAKEFTHLKPGTTYTVSATAINCAGYSQPANKTTSTTSSSTEKLVLANGLKIALPAVFLFILFFEY